MPFNDLLMVWYLENSRDLPWRETKDPYRIWLSEILLQQTRVEQGMPYYHRFIENYPTLQALALAPEDDVLRLWQGLGYYSRGRNLLFAARQMMAEYGRFPDQYSEIRALKGVGDYTAAAVASMAFNLPHAVVDGNVYRFLARYYGIDTPIDSTEGKKVFKELADTLLDHKNPGLHNQAVMEMGALICKPKPLCERCPFSQSCYALKNKQIAVLPVKSKKTKIRNRHFNYLLIEYKEQFYIQQRTAKDIWQGLYEFPLIEYTKPISLNRLMQTDEWLSILDKEECIIFKKSKTIKHQLSHQLLHTVFIHLKIDKPKSTYLKKKCKRVSFEELNKYGMPQLIVHYLKNYPIQSKKKEKKQGKNPVLYFINFANTL